MTKSPLRPAPSSATLLLCLCTCTAGWGQAWRLSPEIQTTLTVTNNAVFGDEPAPRKDVVLDVAPSLRLAGRGARYTLEGEIGLHGIAYARDSEPNRVLPHGNLAFSSVLVPQWLTLDSSASVEQTAADPFGPQPDAQSTTNRLTTSRWMISPALRHEFSPNDSLLLRSDQQWVWRNGDTADADPLGDSHTQYTIFRFAHKPTPLGGSIELADEETSYGGTSSLASSSARAVVSWSPDPQVELGVVGGVEKSRFSFTKHTDPIYGLRAEVAPTERSRIVARVERRYFGTAWDLDVRHRSPFLALSGHLLRRATAQTSSTFLGAGTDSRGLLDAILTTRYPDPVARAAVVNDLVTQLGLPAQLNQPVEVFSDAAQLEQGADVSATFMGRVTVLTLSLFTRHVEQLQRTDDPVPPIAGYTQANKQIGASIGFNRRLSPRTTFDALLQWSRLRGIGNSEGDETEGWQARASMTYLLSPRSTVTVGLRRQAFDSTLGDVRSAQETAAFVGWGHRF